MNSKILLAVAVAATTVSLSAGSANASTVSFTLSSPTASTITFTLPQSPTPDSFQAGDDFVIHNVPVIIGGSPGTDGFTFFTSGFGGGLGDDNFVYIFFSGQMFSGSVDSPAFLPGVYTGDDLVRNGAPDTLIISDTPPTSETPLPSTWLMLLGGFIGLGFFAYRGTKKGGAALAAI